MSESPDERKRGAWTVIIAMVLVAYAFGCDPGYNYRPVRPGWTEKIGDVLFTGDDLNGLIGGESTFGTLIIRNQSDESVIVLGGTVVTKGRTIEGRVDNSDEARESRTILPHTKKSLQVYFDLGGPVERILGAGFTWHWRVKVGEDERILQVPMERAEQ